MNKTTLSHFTCNNVCFRCQGLELSRKACLLERPTFSTTYKRFFVFRGGRVPYVPISSPGPVSPPTLARPRPSHAPDVHTHVYVHVYTHAYPTRTSSTPTPMPTRGSCMTGAHVDNACAMPNVSRETFTSRARCLRICFYYILWWYSYPCLLVVLRHFPTTTYSGAHQSLPLPVV